MELSTEIQDRPTRPTARPASPFSLAALTLMALLGLSGAARADSITINSTDTQGWISIPNGLGNVSAELEINFLANGLLSATAYGWVTTLYDPVEGQDYVTDIYSTRFVTIETSGDHTAALFGPGTTITAALFQATHPEQPEIYHEATGFTATGPGAAILPQTSFSAADTEVTIVNGGADPTNVNWVVFHFWESPYGNDPMGAFRVDWNLDGSEATITLQDLQGLDGSGQPGDVYVIPGGVPEPGTVALAGLGAVAAIAGRRRSARR